MAATTQSADSLRHPESVEPPPRRRLGLIVATSLATALVAAVVLVAAPLIPAEREALTGAVLLGFAVGWALLAVLSVRFSDQPQRWAAAPAVFMGLAGANATASTVFGRHRPARKSRYSSSNGCQA
jgi:hypothetical protein